MSLDIEVENAILSTVEKFGQSEKVAKRLISWLQELSDRELSVDENNHHFEVLKTAIDLGTDSEN